MAPLLESPEDFAELDKKAKESKYQRDWYRRRKEKGLCVDCAEKAPSGRVRCPKCTEKYKKKPGKCRRCGKPVKKYSRCLSCRRKVREYDRSRAESGICLRCNNEATAGVFCFRHWVRHIGSHRKLNFSNGGADMLLELWKKQRGLCAVTGMELIPGYNASLDHIVPVSKGGDDTKENLRWILLSVNKAKDNMTHQQFVEMCRLVVEAEDAKSKKIPNLRSIAGGK